MEMNLFTTQNTANMMAQMQLSFLLAAVIWQEGEGIFLFYLFL